MTVASIAETLGAPRTIKAKISSQAQLREATRFGLPAEVVTSLASQLGMQRAQVTRVLGIPERTLSRRINSNGRLTAQESDRAVRLARVLAQAKGTFGSLEKARTWLQTSNRALRGEQPFELLDTDAGVQSVETVLGRIDYGIYS
jgi:putative toxin-antitoxin system antitoxin component (TIGR02293 family)